MEKIELDYDAIGEILRETVRDAVNEVAADVASRVDADGAKVGVRPYTTDRAAAAVTILDPRGLALQAKNGALTKAAAAAGLEVTER